MVDNSTLRFVLGAYSQPGADLGAVLRQHGVERADFDAAVAASEDLKIILECIGKARSILKFVGKMLDIHATGKTWREYQSEQADKLVKDALAAGMEPGVVYTLDGPAPDQSRGTI